MTAKIFISYSHVDKPHIERLHKHLAQLERDGTISGWYDREIHAGDRFDQKIERQLNTADIFLACASPDYLASDYCIEKELEGALRREREGKLSIIPIILEPCEWLQTPLSKFKAVPEDGKPVSDFTNFNVAFLNVATEIRRLCTSVKNSFEVKSAAPENSSNSDQITSRYRVKREFDKLHKRDFAEQAFAEIYAFFEVSSQEMQSVPDVDVRLVKNSGDRFSCTVINRGMRRGFETLQVRLGAMWAIDILYGEEDRSGVSNGGFNVEADDYQLYLKPSMFAYSRDASLLSPREAGQMLWDQLLTKVGIDYA